LFKVTITHAHLREAVIGPVTDTGGISANPDASPTLIYMTANNHAQEPYVAVGTATGRVLTFSVAGLTPGPHHSTGGQYDRAMTPAVPVTPSGLPPGAPGSGRPSAPHFFLASTDGKTTTLHRVIRPDFNRLHFEVTDSVDLPGAAGPAVATNQFSLPEGSSSGLVYVTTDKNLYALDARDLTLRAQFSPTELTPGTGFGRNAPSVTANVVFVARDNGEQLVLDAGTLQPVPAGVFRSHPQNAEASASFGQAGLSHDRRVLYASDRGVFVYALS
jgi:outer membrane protein assembly factor BamB